MSFIDHIGAIFMPKKSFFDKEASLALKGIAIMMMMLHHNFRAHSLFDKYTISFYPFNEQQVVNLATSCKICVSLFAFISGYGLFLSCRRSNTNPSKWFAKRYILTFSGFWFVWVVSAIITQLVDGRLVKILCKEDIYKSIMYIIIDFLGLAKLFHTPTLNGTWWYMSAAAVFILMIPVLYKFKDYLWPFLFLEIAFIRIIHTDFSAIIIDSQSTYAFLIPLTLGAIFANYGYLEKWCAFGSGKIWIKIIKFAVELPILFMLYKMYRFIPLSVFREYHTGLYPIAFILFVVEFVLPLTPIRKVLGFFGKHSMNVFLTHTFIRAYYLPDFTYSWKHFALICLVLLIACTAISIVIEAVKSLLRYNKLIGKLTSLCD